METTLLNELEGRLNDLYKDWFDTLRAEVVEGGSLPRSNRSATHLTYGLDAVSRKIEKIRAELAKIDAEKQGQAG